MVESHGGVNCRFPWRSQLRISIAEPMVESHGGVNCGVAWLCLLVESPGPKVPGNEQPN